MAVTINGSAGVTTNSGAVYNGLQTATAVASTSGTSIDFTSIPSWVRRITVMFQGVSTNGTSNYLVQVGSSSFTTSGYVGGINNHAGATGANFSTGFMFFNSLTAANIASGVMTINLQTANVWVEQSSMTNSAAAGDMRYGSGYISLSGTLDRVRITTVNGTDTFDAGTINIIYE